MSLRSYLAIWRRVIEPNKGNMTPAAAEGFLNCKLSLKDANRMKALATKAKKRTMNEKESQELRTYREASGFLTICHIKARLSLKQFRRKNVARARR